MRGNGYLQRYANRLAMTEAQRQRLLAERDQAKAAGKSVTVKEHERALPVPLTGTPRKLAAIEALERAAFRVHTTGMDHNYTSAEKAAIARAVELIADAVDIPIVLEK